MTARVIADGGKTLIRWAEEHLDRAKFRRDAVTIGVERDGIIRAVAVYDTFSTTGCLVHLVSDGSKKWMTREFLTAGFAYPFITCNFPGITTLVSENNAEALRLNTHLGWRQLGRLEEDGHDGEANIVMRMLRRECRWIPQTFRRLDASASSARPQALPPAG
jgi:hypothetical protein